MTTLVLYSTIDEKWFSEAIPKWLESLNIEETQRFYKMKSELKRKQLLLSRCLLQCALNKLGFGGFNRYEIVNFNQLVLLDYQQTFSISISHSGKVAAIILSDELLALGIDVEQNKPRHFTELAQEFCTEEELNALAKNSSYQEGFYKLWTIKEALAKASQTPLVDLFPVNFSTVLFNQLENIRYNDQYYFPHFFTFEQTIGTILINKAGIQPCYIYQGLC